MLKPIVSMNQMAMNESIATTCCYVWNGTSLLGSASLPHGGALKANSKSPLYLKLSDTDSCALNSSWLNYHAGHVNNATYAGYVINKGLPGRIGSLDETPGHYEDWVVYKHNATADWEPIRDTVTTALKPFITAVPGGYCAHNGDANCPYYKVTSFAGSFTHTGATSGHYTWTGGNSWLADHTAVQYSS